MSEKPSTIGQHSNAEEEFAAMHATYAEPIYRFLYWRTNDHALAEDITSNVFEKAWRSRDSFRGGSAKAWLFRIARNLLIDHWRLKKDEPLENEDLVVSTATSVEETMDNTFRKEALERALGKLPPEMRTVLKLRFIDGLSAKQVATKLAMTEGNVRVVQYRALLKMRKDLK